MGRPVLERVSSVILKRCCEFCTFYFISQYISGLECMSIGIVFLAPQTRETWVL